MARILYGVHGTGHGHAMRALGVARHFPQHEFLFVSSTDGLEILKKEYEVVECPNPETPISSHRVAGAATLFSSIKVHSRGWQHKRKIGKLFESFQPQAAISDYEYFIPRVCRQKGLPCLSLDHQHVVTLAGHSLPWGQYPSYLATHFAINAFFSRASDYLIISFYRPPLKPGNRAVIAPPILRDTVIGRKAVYGEHVLAYHGYQTFPNFFEFLRKIDRKVIVYGSHVEKNEGNLVFKKNSEQEFLEDLAGSAYVVCGGGHTLMSEALYLGKPLMVFPIKGAFEQYLNAHYLEKLGYGLCLASFKPPEGTIGRFEKKLDVYRDNIGQVDFCGNQRVFDLIQGFVDRGRLPL